MRWFACVLALAACGGCGSRVEEARIASVAPEGVIVAPADPGPAEPAPTVSEPPPAVAAPTVSLEWAIRARAREGATFPGPSLDSIGTDDAGNVWVSASNRRLSDWNETIESKPLFISKFDRAGTRLWTVHQQSHIREVTRDGRALLVPTTLHGESTFFAELMGDGSVGRTATYRGDPELFLAPPALASTADGGVIAAFATPREAELNGARVGAGMTIVKFDAAWAPVWSTACKGGVPSHVRISDDGTVAVAGTAQGVVDFGGGPLTAAVPVGKHPAFDVFVAAFDAAGRHRWSKVLSNGPNLVGISGLDSDRSGGVVLSMSRGLRRFDRNGALLWEHTSESPVLRDDVAFASDGSATEVWTTWDETALAWNAYLTRYSTTGVELARHHVGVIQPSKPGRRLVYAADGALVLGATFLQPIKLGETVLTPFEAIDMFVARIRVD